MGLASSTGCLKMWEGSPIYSLWGFLGSFSPFQSPAKAGIQEERIHCRTWEELKEYFGSG